MGIFDEQKCRFCGCTWNNACEGGCYWVEVDLCSKCAAKLENEENKRIKKIIDEAPERCLITGLLKCKSYTINDEAVYITNPAYDAYTLPNYNAKTGEFFRVHYDMDDNCREEYEYLCHIDELRKREDFEEIKVFYNIN